MRVLVLDARQRAALACTRSLGMAGYEVITADEVPYTLAGSSKYSSNSLVYPSPYSKPEQFLDWAGEIVVSLDLDALLPVTEVTTDLLVRYRERWPALKLPFSDIKTIDKLSNKVELYELALSLGVPVPDSAIVNSADFMRQAVEKIGLPAVLKPARSRVLVDGEWKDTSVKRINDSLELKEVIATIPDYYFPALYQKFVPGKGAGVFALYRDGQLKASFSHKRLREKPPEGGVSVLSESCLTDKALLAYATSLLNAVCWEGVAMVEYRVSDEGEAYLMEVNARLWGSLQLAIDAGVDFPRMLLLGEVKSRNYHAPSYKEGVRLHWLLGDLDRLYLLFKRWRSVGGWQLIRESYKFLITPFTSARNETLRFSDPGPGMHELRNYFRFGE